MSSIRIFFCFSPDLMINLPPGLFGGGFYMISVVVFLIYLNLVLVSSDFISVITAFLGPALLRLKMYVLRSTFPTLISSSSVYQSLEVTLFYSLSPLSLFPSESLMIYLIRTFWYFSFRISKLSLKNSLLCKKLSLLVIQFTVGWLNFTF